MGKHRDEYPEFKERTGRLGVASADVDQIGNKLERIKRNAQRQHDGGGERIGCGGLKSEQFEIVEHEQCVFEEGEVEHVQHDADPEYPTPARAGHQMDDAEGDHGHGHEQDQEPFRVGGIENRVGNGKQPQALLLEQQVRDQQHQEENDEVGRVEEHGAPASFLCRNVVESSN